MKLPQSSKIRFRRFISKPPDAPAGKAGEKPRDKSSSGNHLRDYRNWLRPFYGALAGVFALALVTSALNLAWPWGLKHVMDLLPADMPWEDKSRQLTALGLGIFIVLLIKTALETLRSYLQVTLNARLVFRLRKRLFGKLLRLSLGELGEMKTGGVVSRLSGDIDSVSGLVNLAIINPAVAAVQVVLTVAIVVYASVPRQAVTDL